MWKWFGYDYILGSQNNLMYESILNSLKRRNIEQNFVFGTDNYRYINISSGVRKKKWGIQTKTFLQSEVLSILNLFGHHNVQIVWL